MKKLLIAFLLLFFEIAYAECPRPTLKEAAAIDVGSTVLAVAEGASEANPLGLIGTTLLKGFVIFHEDEMSESSKSTASAVWTGAGVNNLMIVFGSSFYPAILTGVIVGLIVKLNNNCEKEN